MPSLHLLTSLYLPTHLPKTPLLLKPQTLTLTIPTLLRSFSYSPKPTTTTTTTPTRVSLYLHRSRLIDSLRLRLRSHDPSTPFPLPSSFPIDSFVAVHALRSAPSSSSALSLFDSLRSHPSFSHHLLHSLAKLLSLSRRLPDLHSLLDAIDAGSFPSTLPPTPIDRLRWLVAAGDLPSSLRIWSSIRSAASLRNHHPCTESYNLIIALYTANQMDSDAVSTFSQMVEEGANPNSRTYTVIIDHLVRSGNLDPAIDVFDRLPSMRIRRTSKQYNLLAEALFSAERFDEVRKLIGEMRCDGMLPGRAVRIAMARMREAGCGEGMEEFLKEFSPDERIGYVVENGEGGGSEEENDEDDGNGGDGGDDGGDRIKLKPWLDPSALARALCDWDPIEVSTLEEAKFVWTSRLVCKLLRSFKKPETAWEFFCWVAYQPGGFAHDQHTVSRMISILARNGHSQLVDRLLSKVKDEGIPLPFGTVRLVVDFYGLSKSADAALKVFRDVNSICGPVSNSNRRLLYSSLLRTLVKCKRGNEAMDLLEEMMMEGVLPDIQIFSGLMQYFAGEGDLKSVHKLFGMVKQCGLEPDAYMYRVLIWAYCKHERAALALRVFEEMRNSNLVPDGATKAMLVKSLWKERKLREAALVEERCEEVVEGLPVALAGHVWTVSSADFRRIYDIYSSSFLKRGE